jgi:hypothetical protein
VPDGAFGRRKKRRIFQQPPIAESRRVVRK